MGLFVLQKSNSNIDLIKATISNLKLSQQVYGSNHLIENFSIPLLEKVLKNMETPIKDNI